MDYQALSITLSVPVQQWTIVQIQKWLNFIHMDKFLPLFNNNQFNGQTLIQINPKILDNIGITSNIMKKKLMAWVDKGFLQFNLYLKSQQINKQNICPNLNQRKTSTSKQKRKNNKNIFNNQFDSNSSINNQIVMNNPFNIMNSQSLINSQIQIQNIDPIKLRVTTYEGPQNVYYIADHRGLKIGRSLNNQIQSLQVTIENQHAKIIQNNHQFQLIDLGTKSGTFIKVHYKLQLHLNTLIQIGSYLLKVKSLNMFTKQIEFECQNQVNNQFEQLNIDFNQKPSFSMGRKAGNDFTRQDQHMSGTHAKIYYLNGKFILEDMGSTNGTWLRLSEFGQSSQPYTLKQNTIFKVGNTITYQCQYLNNNLNNKMQIQQNSHICTKCQKNQRNILFLPCKHTICCQGCSQGVQQCLLCRHLIEEKIKIFI